jgi:hypothetical protein
VGSLHGAGLLRSGSLGLTPKYSPKPDEHLQPGKAIEKAALMPLSVPTKAADPTTHAGTMIHGNEAKKQARTNESRSASAAGYIKKWENEITTANCGQLAGTVMQPAFCRGCTTNITNRRSRARTTT